jgi:hypothetical protein
VYGDEVDENKAVQCSLIVSHQCLLRNKRCLLAYLYVLGDYRPHRRRAHRCCLYWTRRNQIPAPGEDQGPPVGNGDHHPGDARPQVRWSLLC